MIFMDLESIGLMTNYLNHNIKVIQYSVWPHEMLESKLKKEVD